MLTGVWRDIPGSEKYQIDSVGNIRRKLKKGFRNISTFIKDEYYTVKVDLNGIYKECKVHMLIALAFGLIKQHGEVYYFKNRNKTDCFLSNIAIISKSDLAKITGAYSNKKAVVKIDPNGEIVEFYKSARECARCNYMSNQTISDRCNKKVKSKFAPDGYEYKWDSDLKY